MAPNEHLIDYKGKQSRAHYVWPHAKKKAYIKMLAITEAAGERAMLETQWKAYLKNDHQVSQACTQ